MPDSDTLFHDGECQLQERFDSTRLAKKVADVTIHNEISDRDRAFIEARDMFFLATSDGDGNLDCSYKGGDPGFVRVMSPRTLAFPSYDGNGMFMSGGNILAHPKVGMLFIDWENGWRMRINGVASVQFEHPLLAEHPEAQFIIEVVPDAIFLNCPRYVHHMQTAARSEYVPRAGIETPDHWWKDAFEDALPLAQQQKRAARRQEQA